MGSLRKALGDLNTKLGRKIGYRSCISAHSLHTVANDNGSKLIDFAVGKSLVIKNTMFRRKNIHKFTWVFSDERYKNQIDHILVNTILKNRY